MNRSKLLVCLIVPLLVLVVTCTPVSPPSAVFPGAEGFGKETIAGRRGAILKVTNLNDSGRGSLREAINTNQPRTIVFEVGGIIPLKSDLHIVSPNITIAGQTAPNPGITLKNAGLFIRASDVLVQHLRIRVGDESGGPAPIDRDAIAIVAPASNVVVDHVSVSWAVDENVSIWGGVENVTISNSIISESLHESIHPKGAHGKGLLVGNYARKVALIGNLLAHNDDRNPRITDSSSVVVLNNLIYNARNLMLIGDPAGPSLVTATGNLFIDGPDSRSGRRQIEAYPASAHPETKIYQSANKLVGSKESVIWGYATPFDPGVTSPPVWQDGLSMLTADIVEERVLNSAGARPADRDEVDRRIISDVRQRTGSIINSQKQVGGWPETKPSVMPFIVPNAPNDDVDRDGYTNLENLLHQISAQVGGSKGGVSVP